MRFPLLSKLMALLLVIVLLMFGLSMIEGVVSDRQFYRSETERSVVQSLAGSQTLVGPIIHSSCVESWDVVSGSGKDRSVREQRREFMLTALPENLRLRTGAAMEERARGLHKVNAYTLKAQVTADWPNLAQLEPQRSVKDSRMQCGAPILMMAVGDARGIRTAQMELDGKSIALKPGTFHPIYTRGLHASLPDSMRGNKEPLNISLDLELVGTQNVSIVPIGGNNDVQMQSSWPHPSFAGRFLPSQRDVSDAGFQASWRVSSLATTAQQDVRLGRRVCGMGADQDGDYGSHSGQSYDAVRAVVTAAATTTAAAVEDVASIPTQPASGCADSFSVSFVDPVNPYSLADRATKYGVLFIALTFVAVGLFELMKKLRVHPVQYLLVGAALCSFFLLLVSLSEHLSFGLSYAIASSACVLLLGYYASHILGGFRMGLPFGLGIALLYGMLYVLLQLEQTALVVGSIALFAVLGVIMVLTRKVNWYALSTRNNHGSAASSHLPADGAAA
ncbi:cell envelope integrity protein CreD [Diaphorobacter aerolatus]|uniref:Cell envelope integrity protein CreD n=1 Tax=Diaphorobacter aerolatus TaxID=1288495 RepID=A0A7H0GFQ0_9BURK|nr:cell envelope integrity protein CreD [Diaphorobacter aerolatus]QNP47116.1 cell envelope integrity protein CreD [Diaphorobacter aerolatus]